MIDLQYGTYSLLHFVFFQLDRLPVERPVPGNFSQRLVFSLSGFGFHSLTAVVSAIVTAPVIPFILHRQYRRDTVDDIMRFIDPLFRHRRLLAPDSGIAYLVQATRDLLDGSWTPAIPGEDLVEIRTTPTGDGLTEEIEYRVPSATLDTPRHFRLQVSPSD